MHRVYLLSKVKNALATDERVGLSDLQVHFTDTGRGVVAGEVNSTEQQQAVTEVLKEIPGAEDFLNRTHLRTIHEPGEPETITSREGER